MLTLERRFQKTVPEQLNLLPEVEYPEEYLRELDELVREAEEDFQAGKLMPMTAAEIAAEFGIALDGDE